MGRRKLVMKRIENNAKRLVTFSKRRTGLIKKANELSILCDVDVSLVVFSSSGKLYQFSSSPDSLINLIKHQHNKSDVAEGAEAAKHKESLEQENAAEPERPLGDLLKIVQRQVGQPGIEMMGVDDLLQLERQLHSALSKARSQQAQLKLNSINFLRQQEKDLKEEGQQLKKELAELVAGYDHFPFLRDLNLPTNGNHDDSIPPRML